MAAKQKNLINPNAEIVAQGQCLQVNVAAARGLQMVLKSNLGPRGTLKMLVGGAGQIKITKDGSVLLHEMQIQHPTPMMIARAATAMDDEVGDGTTSTVLFIGELLKQAERFVSEGLHPRLITEGYDIAKEMVTEFLQDYQHPFLNIEEDRELLTNVARASLRTKLSPEVADTMSDAVVDSVLSVRNNGDIDLHMVEIMCMEHKSALNSCFVKGIVLDHGTRHPDMPTYLKNPFILTCNVSLEYEKTEVNAGFFYSDAAQREKLVDSERKFTDEKVRQVIEFKRRICTNGETFCLVNQKGIDGPSLDMLAKEGIMAFRRAKRRNMERLTLACGGVAVNSFDDLDLSSVGRAGSVREETLGEDKFTFIEDAAVGKSCTILIRGPNKHTIEQLKDATRDGLRSVTTAVLDKALVPGAGAFEMAASRMLMRRKSAVSGKAKLGVEAFAQALLVVPKTLAENSGFDVLETMIKLEEEQERSEQPAGIDLNNGDTMLPSAQGIWDSVSVKKQSLQLATVLATQLLLVDEVMKAGKAMGKQAAQQEAEGDADE